MKVVESYYSYFHALIFNGELTFLYWTFDFSSASSIPACMMFKGGRLAKAVWEHFVKQSVMATVARCKLCGHQMSTKCDFSFWHQKPVSDIVPSEIPFRRQKPNPGTREYLGTSKYVLEYKEYKYIGPNPGGMQVYWSIILLIHLGNIPNYAKHFTQT